MSACGALLNRLEKVVREASPLGHCFRYLAGLLSVTEEQVRDAAQVLMVPAGRFMVQHGICTACRHHADVFRAGRGLDPQSHRAAVSP
jgi:hypothetical protein